MGAVHRLDGDGSDITSGLRYSRTAGRPVSRIKDGKIGTVASNGPCLLSPSLLEH
jgi:hypothetical protein